MTAEQTFILYRLLYVEYLVCAIELCIYYIASFLVTACKKMANTSMSIHLQSLPLKISNFIKLGKCRSATIKEWLLSVSRHWALHLKQRIKVGCAGSVYYTCIPGFTTQYTINQVWACMLEDQTSNYIVSSRPASIHETIPQKIRNNQNKHKAGLGHHPLGTVPYLQFQSLKKLRQEDCLSNMETCPKKQSQTKPEMNTKL